YAVTPTVAIGIGLANYAIAYMDGTMSVTVAAVTVVVTGGTSLYNGAPHGAVCTATTSTGASMTGVLSYAPGPGVPTAAGTYTATCTAADANQAGTGAATLTITPRPVTVRARDTSKVYGTVVTFTGSEFTVDAA